MVFMPTPIGVFFYTVLLISALNMTNLIVVEPRGPCPPPQLLVTFTLLGSFHGVSDH